MTGLNSSHGVKTADLRIGADRDRQARRLSMILSEIANNDSRDRVSIGDLCDAFHDRAFGALMLIFAASNVIPGRPGRTAT